MSENKGSSAPAQTAIQAAMAAQKPKNMWGTIKRLAGYMQKSSLLIAFTIIAAIAGTVMQVVSPKMLGGATTVIFEGVKNGEIDFNRLGITLLIAAALYIGVFASSFLQQRLMVLVAQKAAFALRNQLKEKMNKVPVSFFDKNPNGALMSVASNDIENIVTNLQQCLTELVSSIILVIGIAWFIFSINVILALVTCAMVPAGLLVMKAFTPAAKNQTRSYFGAMGKLNGHIEEIYQGFTVVKTFNGEDDAIAQFEPINEKMYETGWKSRTIASVMTQCVGLAYNLIYVAIAIIGAIYVTGGTILIGDMQAFFQYSTQFSIPFTKFAQLWGNMLSAIASAERVFNMIDAEEMPIYSEKFPSKPNEASKVAFDHARFGYTEQPLMKDFSMQVPDGQMIAIVGHTGAGKTTLINLIERFYEIQGGSIRIDGEDIRNISTDDLRKQIGMVLQDTWLFSGTIYDNIKYGNESASRDQVIAAAKAAYADGFITKLPDGYETILSEDAENISGGQRQLITIARAFVANPEILILDEATSNVDSRTELIIQSAMKRLLKGRTSFVVAHRLSTIYGADRIIVMDSGDIVETGSHSELLCANGVYAEIYNSQFAGVAA